MVAIQINLTCVYRPICFYCHGNTFIETLVSNELHEYLTHYFKVPVHFIVLFFTHNVYVSVIFVPYVIVISQKDSGTRLIKLIFKQVISYDVIVLNITASTICWINGGLMLGQRLRRWPNIKPPLIQHFVFDVMQYMIRHVDCGCFILNSVINNV